MRHSRIPNCNATRKSRLKIFWKKAGSFLTKRIQALCITMPKIKEKGIDRKIAPTIVDAARLHIELPKYEMHVLSNGVEVYLFDMGTQETMMVNWILDAGNW